MTTIRTQFKKWPVISGLSMFFLAGTFAGAQSAPGSNPQDNNRSTQDRDITRRELANFDEFLDSHRETAEQVRKDPSLLENRQFLKDHPDLQRYLWNHPGVREEVKENPTAFMRQENRYDRQEDVAAREATREKLASFDQFLDKHREIAEQVRRNPSLLDNPQFLKDHPEVQAYLQDHTGVRNAVKENPDAFMRQENRYDRQEDARDRDTTRGQLASFDQFLDKHREVAEQVRKDPSLLDNQQFLKDHPALQSYLQDHQGVREEVRENPNAFMRQENRYDRREDARDRDTTRGQLASFDQFLDKHREVAEQVRKDPSLLDNQQFLKDHPALQSYLQDHQGVREEVRENPNAFMRQENRYDRREDARDRDTTRGQLASFDQFLDKHREVAEQVRKDPSLLDNQQFLKDHPALQSYLQDHQGVREEVRENPNAFMRQENRYDRREDARDRDTTRGQLASFDQFLDKHREVAEQVRKDPSLLDNQQFLKDHPALQSYLQDHQGIREEVRENPNAFMRQENRYDRREDARDRDTTRGQLASFDQFLDKQHHEVAEQVRKDPSLLDNPQFLKDHPTLQAYLQDHQGVSEEVRENPNAFMRQENRYDRTEAERGDPDTAHRHFGEFLGHHMDISRDLDKDPSIVKKDEYIHNHPELQAYLNAHPEVRQGLMADPQGFVKSTQQFNTKISPAKTTTAPTTAQPKP